MPQPRPTRCVDHQMGGNAVDFVALVNVQLNVVGVSSTSLAGSDPTMDHARWLFPKGRRPNLPPPVVSAKSSLGLAATMFFATRNGSVSEGWLYIKESRFNPTFIAGIFFQRPTKGEGMQKSNSCDQSSSTNWERSGGLTKGDARVLMTFQDQRDSRVFWQLAMRQPVNPEPKMTRSQSYLALIMSTWALVPG